MLVMGRDTCTHIGNKFATAEKTVPNQEISVDVGA